MSEESNLPESATETNNSDPLDTSSNFDLILLDRDGVINEDSAAYIKSAAEWQAIPGAIAGIVSLQKNHQVAVCTNQSGLGRGLFTTSALADMHEKMNREIVLAGGQPIRVFYCPHHPDDRCACRKPKPQLLHSAIRSFSAKPGRTLYIGDSEKDLLAAEQADCTGALVLTGKGQVTVQSDTARRTVHIYPDLASAALALIDPSD